MNRPTRTLLLSAATVTAAISLSFAAVAAEDEAVDEMGSMAPMEEMEPGLHVMEAWVRESPMTELAGAAYMVIHNDSDDDDALVGASSPAAGTVELHLSSMDDEGMMSMNPVTEVPVPAHGDAILEPGSYHIMLIDLVEPLAEGAEVELSLEFMNAEPQTVTAQVMAGAPMMGNMDMDMDHDMDMGDDGDETTTWTWATRTTTWTWATRRARFRDAGRSAGPRPGVGVSTMLTRLRPTRGTRCPRHVAPAPASSPSRPSC